MRSGSARERRRQRQVGRLEHLGAREGPGQRGRVGLEGDPLRGTADRRQVVVGLTRAGAGFIDQFRELNARQMHALLAILDAGA